MGWPVGFLVGLLGGLRVGCAVGRLLGIRVGDPNERKRNRTTVKNGERLVIVHT